MESHAKRFVPTESNDFFFYSIFFLREVFLWMDDNPQNFHGILLFDLQCWIFLFLERARHAEQGRDQEAPP